MVNQILVNLLTSYLGAGKTTSKGNHAFKCPSCNHHKLKLEINCDDESSSFQSYQCWVCGFKGKKLTTLFKFIKGDVNKLKELKLVTVKSVPKNIFNEEIEVEQLSELPKEFKPLSSISEKNIVAKKALQYLKLRNITQNDILKYNIGYCESGTYENRIVIPSYDSNGKLNYFVTRSIDPDAFLKYKNPKISRDIIPFELFINWDSPIILCEGVFDAIAIKRNAIPLLGKILQPALLKKLVLSSVKKVYIALDDDAQEEAFKHCEYLMSEGKEIYIVELSGKDPSQIGFEEFTKIIQKTRPLRFSTLLEKKLSLC